MKRIIGAILAFCMIAGVFSPASADDGDKVYKTLMYNDRKSETAVNFEVEFTFNDSWFNNPATEYNHSLAKTLSVLSGAAYVDKNPGNLISTLKEMGFESESIIAEYPVPTIEDNDTAGYVIAKKTVGDKDVVAVIIKGTGEDEEWYSNFNIGLEGDTHAGFLTASGDVWESLEGFMENLGDNVKILVTGHSRGGAVANIIAAKLIDSGYATTNNLYAYTFASPLVSTAACEEGYESIFNILSSVDFVTRLPVAEWGYKRYGKDLFIPSKSFSDPAVYGNMLEKVSELYVSYTDKVYAPYEGSVSSDNLSRYLFTKTDKKRDFYYEELYKNETDKATFAEYFNVMASNLVGSEDISQSLKLLEYDMDFAPINEFFVINHISADRIFSAHSMASYYSWLSVCDENDLVENADFIRIKVSSHADIKVYDKNADLSAEFTAGEIRKNDIAVNNLADGVYFDIPSEGYTVKITSSSDTAVNISAEKLITSDTDIPVWAKDYYGVVISAGEELEITVGDSVKLTKNNGEILPTYDLYGDIPMYTVKPEALGNGSCYGGGKYRKGSLATVTAISSMMEEFDGWYDGETLLSKSETYTFTVDDYTHIYGKFTEKVYIAGDINNDKTVKSDDLSYLLSVYGTDDPAADLSEDGIVNADDLAVLLANFGKSIQ